MMGLMHVNGKRAPKTLKQTLGQHLIHWGRWPERLAITPWAVTPELLWLTETQLCL
jgi:hypothetical protein